MILFASQGRYLSRNLHQVIKNIIGRAIESVAATGLDPYRYALVGQEEEKGRKNWKEGNNLMQVYLFHLSFMIKVLKTYFILYCHCIRYVTLDILLSI